MQPLGVELAGALQHQDGGHSRRQAADAQAPHHLPLHMAVGAVRDGAETLGDGREGQVGANRGRRREAEQQRQQRRHQRASTHPGQTDEDAYKQTGNGIGQRHGELGEPWPVRLASQSGAASGRTEGRTFINKVRES
ncbi:hypothetical protein D3C72_1494910 [compost metagenome]